MAMTRTFIATAFAVSSVAALSASTPVRAGPDKVAFPETYAQGVLYTTVNRPARPTSGAAGGENSAQFREHYATPAAIEAVRKGLPVPSGTVMTMVQYRAKLDAQGSPLQDASGRFIKGELIGFGVLEKRTGWGTEYAAELRNGEWEFAYFTPDKKLNDKMNFVACFQCHKSQANNDFLFTFDKLKAAAR
jgi:Cytochrome P460